MPRKQLDPERQFTKDDAQKFGLGEKEFEELLENIELHSDSGGLERVILYGSRARGDYKDGSNINLVFDGVQPDFFPNRCGVFEAERLQEEDFCLGAFLHDVVVYSYGEIECHNDFESDEFDESKKVWFPTKRYDGLDIVQVIQREGIVLYRREDLGENEGTGRWVTKHGWGELEKINPKAIEKFGKMTPKQKMELLQHIPKGTRGK